MFNTDDIDKAAGCVMLIVVATVIAGAAVSFAIGAWLF
jgi:hypothetical protein